MSCGRNNGRRAVPKKKAPAEDFCSGAFDPRVLVGESKNNFQEDTVKNAGIKFAGFVLVMAMMLAGSGRLWAQDDADADAMSVAQPDAEAAQFS